ncbi:MAG: metallophosphoesterase family protein [Nanoarchaeota archaeon]|nr:metallophosphoesterase family protein [Nanoarchaeota archaeon]
METIEIKKDVKKIGVISDLHIPVRANNIPEKVVELFRGTGLILNAGDSIDEKTLEELEKIAETISVQGNMDSDKLKKTLPEKLIIKIGKFKIGLIHGRTEPKTIIDYVTGQFNEKLDCIIFGHSHHALNEIKDNILLFNPGSPTDTVFTDMNSIGILELNDKIKGKIIKL